MTDEAYCVFEWRIENLSHWTKEVHSDCIESPSFYNGPCLYMQLYPKGIVGTEEHLVVRLCDFKTSFSGELAFVYSDGFLLGSKQQVGVAETIRDLDLPAGPKFKDVLSRIQEEDFITLRLWRKDSKKGRKERICTTINVLKISLEVNPRWIEEMKSDETKDFFYIFPDGDLGKMWVKICSENNKVHFTFTPPTKIEDPFAVEMSVSLMGTDLTFDSCVKKEHVFNDDSPWTFPDSLEKKESVEKRISLFFCLKTKYPCDGPFYMSCANSCVSIESKSKICFPETDSVSVLTKDFMCLYQDQKFSDITLKCDDVTFPVHKNILSARSPVFDRLLSSNMKEAASGEVDIGDLDPSTLGLFLTYLYTGSVKDLQDDRALKLYYAADKYQVPSLKKECSKFLCDSVSVSNVCDILSLADKHSDDKLTDVSHDFILDNFKKVLRSKEWDTFKGQEPLLALNTITSIAQNNNLGKIE